MMKKRPQSNYEIVSCNLHMTGSLERWQYPYFDYVMTMHQQYSKHGSLPFRGTLSEQPSKIIEIFDIFDALSQERDEKVRKEQEQAQRQKERKTNGRR